MEKKETKWIPDEPDINKQQADQTDQQKPEDSKKEVTEAEWLATGRFDIKLSVAENGDKNKGVMQ